MLQYSSQILETDTLSRIFSKISYIHSSHHCSQSTVPLSFPSVEPRVFWSTETTVIPKSTVGKGKRHTSVSRFWTSIVVHSHGLVTYTLETARIDERLLRVVNLSKRVITVEFVYCLRTRKKLFKVQRCLIFHLTL